ncbi:MAG: hypothetical protein RIS35_23 [Pseudomonadota bacterium]|jgi:hypothetical protein
MSRDIVEIVNTLGAHDPLHRMKNRALRRHLGTLSFVGARSDLPHPPLAVVVRTDLRADPPEPLVAHLRRRHRDSLVMMHLPDFLASHAPALPVFDRFVDVYMVPTPEMRDFVRGFTPREVQVLFDPIDFLIDETLPNPVRESVGPLRLMWFGYPESFDKSMRGYMTTLTALVASGEVEFHVVTRSRTYGKRGVSTIHPYDPRTFPTLARNFDACVLSHQPFDFSLPTWVKSENKAVLAIALGLPVVASATPAYGRLLRGLGLDEFLFSTQEELLVALRCLADPARRQRYLEASQAEVLERYGAGKMAQAWLASMRVARARKFGVPPLRHEAGVSLDAPPSESA